jgi:hypothetical protein
MGQHANQHAFEKTERAGFNVVNDLSAIVFDIVDHETRAVHEFIESGRFPFAMDCDSRCWLGRRPASDGATPFQ